MRFKLKTLFIITFVVAVACMVLFTLPDLLSLVILAAVAMATPGALIAGIIYGRGAKRAFAIGGFSSGGWTLWVTPIVTLYLFSNSAFDEDTALFFKLTFAAFYAVILLGGAVCVGVRRLCYQGKNGIRPPRDCC